MFAGKFQITSSKLQTNYNNQKTNIQTFICENLDIIILSLFVICHLVSGVLLLC